MDRVGVAREKEGTGVGQLVSDHVPMRRHRSHLRRPAPHRFDGAGVHAVQEGFDATNEGEMVLQEIRLRTGFQTVMSPPGTRSARIAAAPGPRVALSWLTPPRTEGATPPRIAAIQIRFRSTTAPRWAIGTPRPPLRPGREPSTPQARVPTRRSDAPSSRAARPSSGGRSDVSATGSWVATALSSFRVTPRTSDTSGNHSGNTPRPSPPGPPAVEAPRRRPALGPERP